MATLGEIAAFVQSLPECKKSGTLRIWGQWFGRPMDNMHTCVACDVIDGQLILNFDQGETLKVWNPSNVTAVGATLTIESASRVRWQWYYYGRNQTPENLLYLDYEVNDGKITLHSNFYRSAGDAASLGEPAIQLCGM